MPRPKPSELRALAERDPRLAAESRDLPAFPGFPDAANAHEPSHWNALARAIVFQQLATAAATTIHRRVCALTPGEGFPAHAEFLRIADEPLRGAGLSRNKIDALRDLATRVDDGRLVLDDLHDAPDEDVVARLVSVRGIGEWSAHMFLLFRLGRLDVGAAGDLGVREGLRLLDGRTERPTPKEALARMESWRPLRSVGSWWMWRLVDRERQRARDAARGEETRALGAPSRSRNAPVRTAKRKAADERGTRSPSARSSASGRSKTRVPRGDGRSQGESPSNSSARRAIRKTSPAPSRGSSRRSPDSRRPAKPARAR